MRTRLLPALSALAALAALALASPAAAAPPLPFGHACAPSDGAQLCSTASDAARVPSLDGVPLDVDVYLPPSGDGPFPTIAMLHGFAQSKLSFEAGGTASTTNAAFWSFRLNGNGWRFVRGHTIKVELLGRDAPTYRPSNGASSVSVSRLRISLPTRERGRR